MSPEQRKQLWLWHVGPRADSRPMAPDHQRLDLNGMVVDYYRRSKRHYEMTFHTEEGPATLVCREANGYRRELECDWFPKGATNGQLMQIRKHMDEL